MKIIPGESTTFRTLNTKLLAPRNNLLDLINFVVSQYASQCSDCATHEA